MKQEKSDLRVFFTDEGIRSIKDVMRKYEISQEQIAKTIGKSQGSVSAWLVRRQSMSASMLETFYEALGKDPSVSFLLRQEDDWNQYMELGKVFGDKDQDIYSTLSSIEQTLAGLVNQEDYVLQPFYERFEAIYGTRDPKTKCGLIRELEELLCKYEDL